MFSEPENVPGILTVSNSAVALRKLDVPPESICRVGVLMFPETSIPFPPTLNRVVPFATTRTPVTGSTKIPVPVIVPGVVWIVTSPTDCRVAASPPNKNRRKPELRVVAPPPVSNRLVPEVTVVTPTGLSRLRVAAALMLTVVAFRTVAIPPLRVIPAPPIVTAPVAKTVVVVPDVRKTPAAEETVAEVAPENVATPEAVTLIAAPTQLSVPVPVSVVVGEVSERVALPETVVAGELSERVALPEIVVAGDERVMLVVTVQVSKDVSMSTFMALDKFSFTFPLTEVIPSTDVMFKAPKPVCQEVYIPVRMVSIPAPVSTVFVPVVVLTAIAPVRAASVMAALLTVKIGVFMVVLIV